MSSLEQDNYRLQNELQDMKVRMQKPQQQDLLQPPPPPPPNIKVTIIATEAGEFHIPLAETVPSPEDYKSCSRRCIVCGTVFVLLALAAGGAVAGIILGGAKKSADEDNSVGSSPDAPSRTGTDCPLYSTYFQGPFDVADMNVNSIYSIGCGGYPDELMALAYDEQNCGQCLGSLVATEYGSECPGGKGKISFQLPALGDGNKVYIGFANPSATINDDCRESLIMI
jgi:hypothetical protein